MEQVKVQPEMRFKAGGITATIWQNQGEKGPYATVKLSRSYKDRDSTWKETNSFREGDIPRATFVLNEAYRWIHTRGRKEAAAEALQ